MSGAVKNKDEGLLGHSRQNLLLNTVVGPGSSAALKLLALLPWISYSLPSNNQQSINHPAHLDVVQLAQQPQEGLVHAEGRVRLAADGAQHGGGVRPHLLLAAVQQQAGHQLGGHLVVGLQELPAQGGARLKDLRAEGGEGG